MRFRPLAYGLFFLATLSTAGCCCWHHHHCCYEPAPVVRPLAPAPVILPPGAPAPVLYLPPR